MIGPAGPEHSMPVVGATVKTVPIGQKAVTGAPAQLTTTPTAFAFGVELRNRSDSADPVFWSCESSVTTSTGHELPAGQGAFIPIADASKIYLVCAATGATKVTFAGF